MYEKILHHWPYRERGGANILKLVKSTIWMDFDTFIYKLSNRSDIQILSLILRHIVSLKNTYLQFFQFKFLLWVSTFWFSNNFIISQFKIFKKESHLLHSQKLVTYFGQTSLNSTFLLIRGVRTRRTGLNN